MKFNVLEIQENFENYIDKKDTTLSVQLSLSFFSVNLLFCLSSSKIGFKKWRECFR